MLFRLLLSCGGCELPMRSANIRIKVLVLRDDYIKATVAETAAAHQDHL